MRNLTHPRNLLIIALVMLVLGVVIPFLIVTGVIESTFFLNFLSYVLSAGGLFIGIIGAAMYNRDKNRP